MKKKNLDPIPRTAEGLRDALFDEIDALRTGRSTPVRARTMALLASQIIDSLRVQIQHGRLVADLKNDQAPMQLGSPE